MPKPKVKKWLQQTPAEVEKRAMDRAKNHPEAVTAKLYERTSLVNWLLEKFGAGKIEVKP